MGINGNEHVQTGDLGTLRYRSKILSNQASHKRPSLGALFINLAASHRLLLNSALFSIQRFISVLGGNPGRRAG